MKLLHSNLKSRESYSCELARFIKWDVAFLPVLATEQFLLVVFQASINLQLMELFKLISRHNEIVVDMFAFYGGGESHDM